MKTQIKSEVRLSHIVVALGAIAMSLAIDRARAFPKTAHHTRPSGPWELVVQVGMDGKPVAFPLAVSDENKPEQFSKIFPVVGTAIQVKLEQYIPDLKWETTAVEKDGAGLVVKLTAKGKDLNQEIWLSTEEQSKRSITSGIGGVTLRKVYDPNVLTELLEKLEQDQAVGILSIQEDPNRPTNQYVIAPGRTISLRKSKYKITVLEYIPHFSIDMATRQVSSISNRPDNPAVKVKIDDGRQSREQWLWSRKSSPHMEVTDLAALRFAEFDLGGTIGRYIVAASSASNVWLLSAKNAKTHAERAVFGKTCPFAKEGYFFTIDKAMDHAVIETNWKNGSQKLIHPAVVVTIEDADSKTQALLELNKPFHYKTKSETVVLYYRQQPKSKK
ncbi:MAG: hypothetical protein ACYTEL_07450 [Planctomycetota bacterium]|jgi:hypothetical protein